MSGNDLVVLDEKERSLAAITTVGEAKDLRDQAEALRRYLRDSRRGLKAQNRAARFKFLCERRAGELLLAVPKVQGKRDGSEGLLATLARSGISPHTAYRWMNLARMPEAEFLHAAALCDQDGDELTSTIVYEVVVRHWADRHGEPRSRTAADEEPREDDLQWMARHLMEREILEPNDLAGLSPSQEAVLVQEAHAAYCDFCEDGGQGKVAGQNGWNPAMTVNKTALRALVHEAAGDLKGGKIGHRSIRGLVRIDERVKKQPLKLLPSPDLPVFRPPGRPRPLTHWLDEIKHPVRITRPGPYEQYATAAQQFLKMTQAFTQLRPTLSDGQRHSLRHLLTELRQALDAEFKEVRGGDP